LSLAPESFDKYNIDDEESIFVFSLNIPRAFKLTYDGHSIVFVTDFMHGKVFVYDALSRKFALQLIAGVAVDGQLQDNRAIFLYVGHSKCVKGGVGCVSEYNVTFNS
jgi:hypothetical protein